MGRTLAQGRPPVPRAPPMAVPVYVALVDVCCGEEALELARSALQAALEALPAAARFGLVTFSHRVQPAAPCPPLPACPARAGLPLSTLLRRGPCRHPQLTHAPDARQRLSS